MRVFVLAVTAVLAVALARPHRPPGPGRTSPRTAPPDHPRVYSGGRKSARGIDVDADWVVVDGFTLDRPSAPGVEIRGNHVTLRNTRITAPQGEDGEGDGKGHTTNFLIKDNFCETLVASQTLMFEDIQHTTVTGNTFAAGPDHAIGLVIHSTGARVEGNRVDPSIPCEVGIDDSSREGYAGVKPACAP